MLSVRVTPWHGLGAVLDRPPASVAEAIEAAGLGWSVVKKPLAVDRGSDLPDVLRFVSRAELARIMGVSVATVDRMVAEGMP
jgi:hypothetical protein